MTRARFARLLYQFQTAVEEAKRFELQAEAARQRASDANNEMINHLTFEAEL